METAPQPRTYLWLTPGEWIKSLLPFIFGIIAGLMLSWWNAKAPHLAYTVSDPIPFHGDKTQFGILNVTIINDGSKEAEEVDCLLPLKGCKVQEVKASPDNLSPVVSFDQDKASVKVRLLNAGESLQISALANSPDTMPPNLTPQVRGKGVVGERAAKSDTLNGIMIPILSVLSVILCAIGVFAGQQFSKYNLHKVRLEMMEIMAKEADAYSKVREAKDRGNKP
jgi:hypothetical protein